MPAKDGTQVRDDLTVTLTAPTGIESFIQFSDTRFFFMFVMGRLKRHHWNEFHRWMLSQRLPAAFLSINQHNRRFSCGRQLNGSRFVAGRQQFVILPQEGVL
jgi:hypothetical protein